MGCYRLAGIVLVVVGMSLGCQNKSKSARSNRAATMEAAQSIRANYQKVNPSAKVGLVIAVDAPDQLVAVGDIPVKDFKNGDLLTFIDSKQNILYHGKVVATTADALHVQYDAKEAGKRVPQIGDMAVAVEK